MFTASFYILSASSRYRSVLRELTERKIIVMEGDMIFVNTDSNYTSASERIESLSPNVTHRQSSTLKVVQSNCEDDRSIFAFGGRLGNRKTPKQRASAFGRTASAVFRMVMLQAVQIDERHWPNLGQNTKRRNKQKMNFEVTQSPDNHAFTLLGNNENVNNTKDNARKYWCHYDMMFPHFFIENEVLKNKGREVVFKKTMLILRNFEEVYQAIEITTKAWATMYPRGWKTGEFYSCVEVSCTCKAIENDDNTENIWEQLRALQNAPRSRPHTRSRRDAMNFISSNNV